MKSTSQARSKPGDIPAITHLVRNYSHPRSLGSFKPACVFLLLYEKDGELRLPAILKADNHGYPWANQVALPGGHIDDQDESPEHTAFRELEEEMGITRSHVEFMGPLGHFQTLMNTEIQVFTGIWDNRETIRYDRSEIARVIDIPLNHLLTTHFKAGLSGRSPGWDELLYPVEDLVIWGVTAKIIHYFIELVYGNKVVNL